MELKQDKLMYDIYNDDSYKESSSKFRNHLISLGYYMLQYSVYTKCIGSHTMYKYEMNKVKSKLPYRANIRVFMLTEEQYKKMDMLTGQKSHNELVNEKEKYIEL
ncbi:CRISPR-associated protein Cas2 [Mycoplasmopsis canis UFG4]|uniref:CRISPR-associated endoribonuclease Cas2 n=1 Tax=Mycoplasmopsis canis UFG4 TaxID=1131455 RepID=I1A5G5_9BACT|nr:CRISPR-associated endonuclease Cas2 [Mycoplasmopsis canis]EIE39953.1 CRISPR-associated protein Cas2 [Mycoplasmopsis canis UF31]EIE40169.1 CRISPR-associated protein Cas2 [Mycoplasmopsis canis UF33]EIE41523.1 CRISPR-associated protein Cas2 [Mycoplasmopsis canis UFG1]EIE41736.1 CRISPR-associated protein Cas2 [Mycoplasmopsis canis UFG4]